MIETFISFSCNQRTQQRILKFTPKTFQPHFPQFFLQLFTFSTSVAISQKGCQELRACLKRPRHVMKVRKRMTVKKRRKNEGEKKKKMKVTRVTEIQRTTRCHEGARKVNHVTEITDFTII